MTQKERLEMEAWIKRLESPEGRRSFKATMGCGDKDVDFEIDFAKRLIAEDDEWNNKIKNGFRVNEFI